MIYTTISPGEILANMKHHIYGSRAILEGDVQPFEREELDPNGMNLPLLNGHILDVPKLLMPARSGGDAHIQWTVLSPNNCGDMMLQKIKPYSAHGVNSTAFMASSSGEKHDTSQPPLPNWMRFPDPRPAKISP